MAAGKPYSSAFQAREPLDKDEAELPLRAVEEAKEYGLTPRQWITLRKRFQGEQEKNRLREMEATWKKEVEQSVRPKLREELLTELRAKVEAEIGEKARAKATKELRDAEQSKQTTPAQREAAKELLWDVEVDCRTLAEAASRMREAEQKSLARSELLRQPLFLLLLLGFAPFVWWLIYHHGFTLLSPQTAAFAIPWFMLVCVIGGANSSRFDTARKNILTWAKSSSDYLILADTVRQMRTVSVDLSDTREELQTRLANASFNKQSLDSSFHADTRLLQAARTTVLDDISRTIDPEKILNEDRKRIAAQFDDLEAVEGDVVVRRSL